MPRWLRKRRSRPRRWTCAWETSKRAVLCWQYTSPKSAARAKKGRPIRGALVFRSALRGLCGFLGLVMDDRGLVEDLEDLDQRRLLVGLLHSSELPREARRSGLENLPLGIALFG